MGGKSRLKRWGIALLVLGCVLAFAGAFLWQWWESSDETDSNKIIREFLLNPQSLTAWINRGNVACEGAPFVLPSEGLIGLLYADPARPYTTLNRHTGIDIFGAGASGTVPVVAVADGWLTRRADWLSTVSIRHDDPFQEGRTIWTYYTHMATRDGQTSYIVADFPPETYEKPVKQGQLLGYQGEYAGRGAPIAMHLHFSVVLSDSAGVLLNESLLTNTLDPTPYLRLPVGVAKGLARPLLCQ